MLDSLSVMISPSCATKDIGNKLTKNIGNTSPMGIGGVGEGKGRQGRVMMIQKTKRNRAKGNQPAVLVFGDTYRLSDQSLTHIDEFTMPLNLSVGTHSTNFCQRRVFNIAEPFGIWPRRGQVQSGRRDLAQGLMRTLFIVDREEFIRLFLLA